MKPIPNYETDTVRFGMELTAPTHEERQAEYKENWKKAEQTVAEGKPICLSDLTCQAEQLHIERIEKPRKPRGRLAKLLAQAEASADRYCELKAQGRDAEAKKIVEAL